MTLAIRDIEELRSELDLLLAEHASEPVELRIVPDIAAWAAERQGNLNPHANPVGLAVRDGTTNAAVILLRREISEVRANAIVQRVLLGGHSLVTERLNSPGALAKHLVLHELAHLENNWGQEHEDACDAWAFERM
jgi:hypothetical protein